MRSHEKNEKLKKIKSNQPVCVSQKELSFLESNQQMCDFCE